MVGVNFASGGSGILRYTGYKQSVTSLILITLLLVLVSSNDLKKKKKLYAIYKSIGMIKNMK